MSRLRYFLVVCACGLFWAVLGAIIGAFFRHALGGFVCGLLLGIVYVVCCLWASDKYPGDVWEAKLLENIHAPNLYEILHALCDRTGLDLPTLYYIPRPEPNAFVTANREGGTSVIVTSGLTQRLEKDEVQAVMALMMARLATNSMPGWTAAATLAGVPLSAGLHWQRRNGLAWLGTALLTVFAFPAAALIRLIWDEKTITAADYHAAHLTEQPGALKRALIKIETGLTEEGAQAGNPATAFLFAVPPLLPPQTGAALWRRGLEAFPFRQPGAAERAERFFGRCFILRAGTCREISHLLNFRSIIDKPSALGLYLITMNDIPNPDALLWEALPSLTLNIAQTAALCGISVRQLGYWTGQDYVAAQGEGTRRTYGLEAVRRVLAIRKAMDAGASLRQSLRQVSSEEISVPAMPPPGPTLSFTSHAEAVSRSLIAFFQANPHTRDHAGGLAVKLGWAEDDLRAAAESLCDSGVLTQNVCQGMTIFHSAEWNVSYA